MKVADLILYDRPAVQTNDSLIIMSDANNATRYHSMIQLYIYAAVS